MSQINFEPGTSRTWLTSSQKRKRNATIAETARRVVAQYLSDGRDASACMDELVRAAREQMQ